MEENVINFDNLELPELTEKELQRLGARAKAEADLLRRIREVEEQEAQKENLTES